MTVSRDPRWYPADRLHRARVPGCVRGWLFAEGSLTAHVQALCPSGFHLRLLMLRRARPRADEARALKLEGRGIVLLREVALCCHGTPLVVARTVIPSATLRGRRNRLAGLGRQPLGAVLFADRSTRRGPLAIARLSLHQAGLARSVGATNPVWGRRAVFHFGGAPLLVSEYFLPELIRRRRTGHASA